MANKKFAQLPANMQEALATNAGIILSAFDPANVGTAEEIRANILYATTGGVSTTCVATYKDFGEDVDNCPKNTKELLQVDYWECKMSGTALTVTGDNVTGLFGAADKGGSDVIEVTPRHNVKPEDFKTLWYVCPYGTQGGFVAVKLYNALNTGGFSMQSTDDGKGNFAFDYTGYTSIDNPHEVPFKFYLKATDTSEVEETFAE